MDLQEGHDSKDGLLGFDIIDSHGNVSLVTNWGTDEKGVINEHVMANGLLGNFDEALQIRDTLRKIFWGDHHAKSCKLWAVYSTDV